MNTLDCKDIKALLSGLVDDEVDADTRHQAERHLADCSACRAMINQAERINEMVVLEAQRELLTVGLPAGFEEAVLRRTVYADAYQFAGRRWTSWLGWIAAAACLLLATALWFLDRQRAGFGDQFAEGPENRSSLSSPLALSSARSFIYNGPLPDDAAPGAIDPETANRVDNELASFQPTLASLTRTSNLSADDEDTLSAASNLLDMLARADLGSFQDVERIRTIAAYDNILERLAETRRHVDSADRPAVMAAESVLLRVVQGPLNLDDVRLLHDSVAAMDLPKQIGDMSDRGAVSSSL